MGLISLMVLTWNVWQGRRNPEYDKIAFQRQAQALPTTELLDKFWQL